MGEGGKELGLLLLIAMAGADHVTHQQICTTTKHTRRCLLVCSRSCPRCINLGAPIFDRLVLFWNRAAAAAVAAAAVVATGAYVVPPSNYPVELLLLMPPLAHTAGAGQGKAFTAIALQPYRSSSPEEAAMLMQR